ncbi:MAG: hypothetical protein GY906_39985 [bacterium]|nr:hypothetical protein [bacterium]
MTPSSNLASEKEAYRAATQQSDHFITGVSALLLIAGVVRFDPSDGLSAASIVELTAILLFALALLAGLRKMDHTSMILGTSFTILESQMNPKAATEGPAAGITNELNYALQVVSQRAARAHRLRYWAVTLGILALFAASVTSAFGV